MGTLKKFFSTVANIGKQILPAALPILGNVIAPGIGGVIGTVLGGAVAGGRQQSQANDVLPDALPAFFSVQKKEEKMPMPAALTSFLASAGKGVLSAVGGGISTGVGYRRVRRKRKALSMEEMGKIMVMAHALGKNSPSVMLLTMKAMGGRL